MKTQVYFSLLFLSLLLSGCGNESEESNNKSIQNETDNQEEITNVKGKEETEAEMPKYSVKVTPYTQEGSNVIGLARVYFEDCFVVNNITIIQGKENPFVSMPSYKTKEVDENNKPVYRDYSDSLIIPIL